MSAPSLSYADQLEETQRLKKLGDEICADISEVLEQRGEIAIRTAILTIIDDGDPTTKVAGEIRGKPWGWDHPFDSVGTDARERFADAVLERLRSSR